MTLLLYPFDATEALDRHQRLTAVPGRPAAPDFALPDALDGSTHRLSDYRGSVVIVTFWATWCPSCIREMPSLQRAWKLLRRRGIIVLAINAGETHTRVLAFAQKNPVGFPLLLDPGSTTIGQWSALGLPTTFIIDPEGRIAYRAAGERHWDGLEMMRTIVRLTDKRE